MTPLEFSILRSVAANLRRVRRHIGRGDLGHSFLLFSAARHEFGFGFGLLANEPGVRAPSWERVRRCKDRVETQLLHAITRATTPPRLADPREIAAEIATSLRVLQTRDGLDISDAQVLERAANISQLIYGNYVISERNEAGFESDFARIHRQKPEGNGGSVPKKFGCA